MMSQPVSKASVPRLAPPRRNSRRAGSGTSFAASLSRSLASTPGGGLRLRDISSSFNSTARDDGAQAARHQQRHAYVDDEKADNRRHGAEMHVARSIVSAEECGQPLKLNRLPDGYAGQHDDDAGKDHAEIEELLHGVIDGKVGVGELAAERCRGIGPDLAGAERNELAPEAPGGDAER